MLCSRCATTTRPPNTSPMPCHGPGSLDWDAQPNPFRQFAGCEQWPLPLLADSPHTPAPSPYEPAGEPAAPSLKGFARVLELSLGLAAWKQYGNARWALRCNPPAATCTPPKRMCWPARCRAWRMGSTTTMLNSTAWNCAADFPPLQLKRPNCV